MALLDSFFILFKTNAKEAKKDLKDVERASDDAGRKQDDLEKKNTKAADSFLNVATAAGKAVVAIVGLATIKTGITDTIAANAELARTAKYIGANAADLLVADKAIQEISGNASELSTTLRSLFSQNMMIPALAGATQRIPERLLEIGDQAKALQAQFADVNQGRQAAMAMLKQQGFGEGAQQFFLLPREQMQEILTRNKKLVDMTNEDIEQQRKLQIEFENSAKAIHGAWSQTVVAMAPLIRRISDSIRDFAMYLKDHSEIAVGGIKAIAFAAGVILVGSLISATQAIGAFLLAAAPLIAFMGVVSGMVWLLSKGIEKLGFTNPLDYLDPLTNKIKELYSGDIIKTAQTDINMAMTSPIATMPGNVTNGGRSVAISTGPVSINTQATDAKGIAQDFKGYFEDQLRTAVGNFSDGVAR